MAIDNEKDKKGFVGLIDLASDVSEVDNIVESGPASEPKPSTATQASLSTPKAKSSSGLERKLSEASPLLDRWMWPPFYFNTEFFKGLLGIVAVVILIWLANRGGQNPKKTLYNPSRSTHTYNLRQSNPTPVKMPNTSKSLEQLYEKSPVGTKLLFPVLSRAMDFPKPRGLLNDFAGVIDPVHRHKILAVITELMQKTGIPIVVVTMPTINGPDYNDYANRIYEAWGIGKKGVDKGVLIFLTMKERKMRIEIGYGMEGVIPNGLAGEIRDKYMFPYLRKNQFGQGILNGVVAVAKIIARDAGIKLSGNVRLKRGPGGDIINN